MTGETTVARRLDGKVVAAAIQESLPPRVQAFTTLAGRPPGLGIVLAGHDGGSETYVRNKMIACDALGVSAVLERLPEDASVDAVLAIVDRFNRSESVDGILVQSPLPAGMGSDAGND